MRSLFETLTGLFLLDPWMLLWALLVPAALLSRWYRGSPAVRFAPGEFLLRVTGQFSETGIDRGVPSPWRVRLLPLPRLLQVLGLLLLVLALARPARLEPLPLKTEGIDILLCLDVSSSMSADDMDFRRTRLEVAADAAERFIDGRPDDRIGLVSFARYPDLLCPPTLDHAALVEILRDVTMVESDGPEDATGIGAAVARAAQILAAGPAESRVVILLTDGEENVASAEAPEEIAPLHAAQLCQDLRVRVYTIVAGVGRADRQGGFVPLDTRQVQQLAERTGARFYQAANAGAVTSVYADIDLLEKVEIEEPRFRVEERFLPFLLAAVALLLAGRGLQSSLFEVLP